MQVEEKINRFMAQKEVLTEQLKYVLAHSPFYQSKKQEIDRVLSDFTLENWSTLPFTTKDDLCKQNEAFCAIPRTKIADLSTTSGTSGEAVTIYQSKNDLARLAQNEARSFQLAGLKKGDLIQLMTTMDRQFMAGLAYFLGAQEAEMGLIRTGPGLPELQLDSILKNKPNAIIAVPSFILTLIQHASEKNIDLNATSVERIICIGEAIRDEELNPNRLAEAITSKWNVALFSTYASTEMATAFTECSAQNGCHLNEDLLYLELLDEHGNAVEDNTIGEIVITTIGIEGTPLLRYKTGDLAKKYSAPCTCGRKSLRLGPILGRKNQLIKYKGTSIYPQGIFDVLDQTNFVQQYHVLVQKDSLDNDQLIILLDDKLEGNSELVRLKAHFQANLKVVPVFEFHPLEQIQQYIYQKNKRKPQKITFKS
jgi:phenylacetate-CoA ligase